MLAEEFPGLEEFVDDQGRLVVQILKALYGLVQLAALRFKLLYRFLVGLVFKSNWLSKCMLNFSKDCMVLTLVLYVDDVLLIWFKIEDIEWLVEKLRERLTSLTMETLDAFTYLGMYLEIDCNGNYSIDICDYIVKMCESHMEGK